MYRLLGLTLGVLFACGNEHAAPPPTFTATEIECTLPGDEPFMAGLRDSRRGHDAKGGSHNCMRALEIFLEFHSWSRIVSVIPIEFPVPNTWTSKHVFQQAGTRRLIVVHTHDEGPWLFGHEIRVILVPCPDPRSCLDVTRDLATRGPQLFVPLTDYSDLNFGPPSDAQRERWGTAAILALRRR